MTSLRSEPRRDGTVCCAYCTYALPYSIYAVMYSHAKRALFREPRCSTLAPDMHPRSSLSRERTVKLMFQERDLHRSFVSGKGGRRCSMHGILPPSLSSSVSITIGQTSNWHFEPDRFLQDAHMVHELPEQVPQVDIFAWRIFSETFSFSIFFSFAD